MILKSKLPAFPAFPPHPPVSADFRAAWAQTDFREIKGQEQGKVALEVAAAGGHNVLMLFISYPILFLYTKMNLFS